MGEREVSVAEAVVASIRIEAPPESVFEYFVDPAKLMRWMGVEADIDPRPGGRFWVNVNGADRASGEYVVVDPPRAVSFTWGWEGSEQVPPGSSEVSLSLAVDGDATIVELTHSGLPGGQDDEHRKGWAHYLPRLQAAAATGALGPDG